MSVIAGPRLANLNPISTGASPIVKDFTVRIDADANLVTGALPNGNSTSSVGNSKLRGSCGCDRRDCCLQQFEMFCAAFVSAYACT